MSKKRTVPEGTRFCIVYRSPSQKRRKEHNGNCLALDADDHGKTLIAPCAGVPSTAYGCTAGVDDHPNPSVTFTSVSHKLLRTRCRRCSFEDAQQMHPSLVNWLEQHHTSAEGTT